MLAKKEVRKLREELHSNQGNARSEDGMTPMVRRSYAFAKRVQPENKVTKNDVAFDFFALAAIQIQAAFADGLLHNEERSLLFKLAAAPFHM